MGEDLSKPDQFSQGYKALRFLWKSMASLLPPGFSGTTAELFDLVITDPAVKRRDRFIMELGKRLDELAEKKLFEPIDMLNNDDLSAFLLHSIQIAIRSTGEKKLVALRETTARGTVAAGEEQRAAGYMFLGLLDRLTDYHLILLSWEATPRLSARTYGEVKQGFFDELHYGQPTSGDPSSLREPHRVFSFEGVSRYVEADSYRNFSLARYDLAALGLMEPVLKKERAYEGRMVKTRLTPEVAGHQVSAFGRALLAYIAPVEGK